MLSVTISAAAHTSFFVVAMILMELRSIQALYGSCPPGWVQWRQSCYALLPEKKTWFEAAQACRRPDSGLVVPNSQEENDFIWNEVFKATDGAWIGCTDAAEEGVWLCGGQTAKFINWWPGYPSLNDSERNCARMIVHPPGGMWSDFVSCNAPTNPKWAACEMSASAVPAYHTFTGPNGRVPQRCLLHHDIKNLTVEGLVACGWACRANSRCRSFNLWLSGKKEKTYECQLNDVTRQKGNLTSFNAKDNCYFFDL